MRWVTVIPLETDLSRKKNRSRYATTACLLAAMLFADATLRGEGVQIDFRESDGDVAVLADGKPVATYVYRDKEISRPYFAHVQAPGGIQVTRDHPPVEGRDPTDHPTYHPGVWLAFGDISGSDYWRLKAPVKHAAFLEKPRSGPDRGGFAVLNEYLSEQKPQTVVCRESNRLTWHVRDAGFLIEWDSTFMNSEDEFYFGDQEEMGIAFRIASPMYAQSKGKEPIPKGTGRILDARGRIDEDQIWSHDAAWCDYSGKIDGVSAGITVFCHPGNFRVSWYHARDYGFLAANPFGREAMGKGAKSKVVVKVGQSLRLRYGILLHSGDELGSEKLAAAYRDYVELTSP